MEIIEDKLLAARRRDAADRIAAVKVKELHKAALHRQLPPRGGSDGVARKRHDAGLIRSVGLNERVEKIGAVVVLREHLVKFASRHGVAQIGGLVDVPAARAVGVDLLKEGKIGRESLVGRKVFDKRDDAAHIFVDRLPTAGAALPAAVHKEAVVGTVRAEARVRGRNAVDGAGLDRVLHGDCVPAAAMHYAETLIADAVVAREHIDDV